MWLSRLPIQSTHEAQVDFAHVRLPWGRRYCLLVVLCYSCMLWLRFYLKQDLRTLFRGLEEPFAYSGGTPHERPIRYVRPSFFYGRSHIVNIRGNSYRMTHHTEVCRALHTPAECVRFSTAVGQRLIPNPFGYIVRL